MVAFESHAVEADWWTPRALVLSRSMSAYVSFVLSYLCIFYEMSGRLSAVDCGFSCLPCGSRANAHLLRPISDLGHAPVTYFGYLPAK